MGWDGYATKDGKVIDVNWGNFRDDKPQIKDEGLRGKFIKAAKGVVEIADGVDWLLGLGGLDCSDCAYALQDATGMNCWGNDITAEKVKEFYDNANWENVRDGLSKELVASAKAFLEVCAREGLGMSFSWQH